MTNRAKLDELFGIHYDTQDDFELIRDHIMKGSCHWILRYSTFVNWKDVSKEGARLLWLTGLPAVGKSTLSSFIIDHLKKDSPGGYCAFYFFKSEYQTKRKVSYMLSSIAFQMALSCKPFREALLQLYDTGRLSLDHRRSNGIWEVVYERIFLRQEFDTPLFWIIDGLDEADHPEVLIRLLSKVKSDSRLRILIISRPMRNIRFSPGSQIDIMHGEINADDTRHDIESYINCVLPATNYVDKYSSDLCAKVVEKAQGSFLWVALILEQLKDQWHTKSEIDDILNNLPEGMESMYV